jgi:hypothetical protein
MSHPKCLISSLLKVYTNEELCSPTSNLHDYFLKSVTRCKCPAHIAENPVVLPTINELHDNLVAVIGELLDWGLAAEDGSGNCERLVNFIKNQCLEENTDSLFSIVAELESRYGEVQEN